MPQYNRVIPRDFFNEAKLLKCLGQLSLSILDNRNGMSQYIYDEFDNDPFDIQQTIDGEIFVANYSVYLKKTDEEIDLYSPLNSKNNYPLCFIDKENSLTAMFEDDGKFSKEFLEFVK